MSPPPCPTCPAGLQSVMAQRCPEIDRAGVTSYTAHTVGREPRPVASARSFTRWTLRDWGLEGLTDTALVIVSELVTNALRHGTASMRLPRTPAPQSVWMGMLRQGETVLCAVFDPGSAIPVVRVPDYLSESGRGLHVVESLSDAWGWTLPDEAGKAVWALLSSPADERQS